MKDQKDKDVVIPPWLVLIILALGIVIGYYGVGKDVSQSDLEAEKALSFAQGIDEAIVVLDAKFNQDGYLIESWRNCLKERHGDDPIIGVWVNSLETFDSTDTMPAVEPDTLGAGVKP